MSAHLINGEFQSDKYPTCPAGKVPLSVKDPTAQDLLYQYAQRRREVDAEFADDLEAALAAKGYVPGPPRIVLTVERDKELEALRAALAWYADLDVWRTPMRAEMANEDNEPVCDALVDAGERAREALGRT